EIKVFIFQTGDYMIKIKADNIEETKRIAKVFADNIANNEVLLLRRDLGAGETTFTKSLVKFLGVRRKRTSPTFNISKSYELESFKVHHMYCYRFEFSDEDLGFDEYFGNGIVIVEWPDFIDEYLPENVINITITHYGDGRLFEIENMNLNDKIMEALDEISFD